MGSNGVDLSCEQSVLINYVLHHPSKPRHQVNEPTAHSVPHDATEHAESWQPAGHARHSQADSLAAPGCKLISVRLVFGGLAALDCLAFSMMACFLF